MRHERTIGSKGHGLWGMKGEQLPAYIQHVYNDMVEGGSPTGSETYRRAVGIVENWAEGHDGKGNKVSAETQSKAAAAIAEWQRLRAKAKVTEAVYASLGVTEASDGDAEDKKDGGADESSEMPSVYCVKCSKKVKPTAGKKCPTCGSDLSKAVAAARKVTEAVLEAVLSAAGRKASGKAQEASAPGPLA
jgi:hypothetical protein